MNNNQDIYYFNYYTSDSSDLYKKFFLWFNNYEDITARFNNFLEGDVVYDKQYNEYYIIIKKNDFHIYPSSSTYDIRYKIVNAKVQNNLLKIYRKRLNKDIEMKLLKND